MSSVRISEGELGSVNVYVDRSLSIQPYLSTGEERSLPGLLRRLDGSLGGKIEFFGFGYAPGDSAQTVSRMNMTALLNPSAYTYTNNDYAALFGRFTPGDTTYIVLTDGVQSAQGDARAHYGDIVRQADVWLKSGGSMAVLLYRVPYEGRYYPESRTCSLRQVAYNCPGRPLVAFVFAPSVESIRDLQRLSGDAFKANEEIYLGNRPLSVRLENTRMEATERGRERRTRVLRDTAVYVVPGFHDLAWGQVSSQIVTDDDFATLTFEVTPRELAEGTENATTRQRDLLEAVRPELQGWALMGRDSLSVSQQDLFARDVSVELMEADSAATPRARIQITVKRPSVKARYFAFLLTLRAPEGGLMLVPSDYSTVDDCLSGACPNTLNLQPMLGAILRDNFIPGRLLFFTEWR